MDIGSKAKYPASKLSNFAPNAFTLDDVDCASMEGFLQGIKYEDLTAQEQTCKMVGYAAKKKGKGRNKRWWSMQRLWWRGKAYMRHKKPYQALLTRAYDAMFEQNKGFRDALRATGDATLTHSIGHNDAKKTVLTESEFIRQLNRLRDRLPEFDEEKATTAPKKEVNMGDDGKAAFLKWVEEKKVGRVACFTGHRPKSFPFKYNENDPLCKAIKNKLRKAITIAYNQGFRTFISGMAMGVDMWAVEILLDMKENGYEDIIILGAIPCQGQKKLWRESTKQRYDSLCKKLDGWKYVNKKPYDGKLMTERNKAMVDASEVLIAVYGSGSGTRSGTGHCYNYANSEGKLIIHYDWKEDTLVLKNKN